MFDHEAMSVDELWNLYQTVCETLAERLEREKSLLERRLHQLRPNVNNPSNENVRKSYPKVEPKYRNPDHPHETWSGRGVKPRWVRNYLATGASLNGLLIAKENAAAA